MLEIGAGVTLERRAGRARRALARPRRAVPPLRLACQIRNAGTIGGNIANGSPIGDCAPALIALGARARAAPRRRRARRCRWRTSILDYMQDRLAARRVRRGDPRAAAARRRSSSAATRSPSASTRTSRRVLRRVRASTLDGGRVADVAHRLRRHGGDAEARAGVPRRRCAASRGPRRRSRGGARRSREDFAPITDMRASAALPPAGARRTCCASFWLETGRRGAAPVVGDARRPAMHERDDRSRRAARSAAACVGAPCRTTRAAAARRRRGASTSTTCPSRRHAARRARPVASARTREIARIDLDRGARRARRRRGADRRRHPRRERLRPDRRTTIRSSPTAWCEYRRPAGVRGRRRRRATRRAAPRALAEVEYQRPAGRS